MSSRPNTITSLLSDLGVDVEEIHSKKEVWQIQRKWRAAFAPDLLDWSAIHLDWECFETMRPRDWLEEGAARQALTSVLAANSLYMTQDLGRTSVLVVPAGVVPQVLGIVAFDLYVFDRDFSWTYVSTHEQQCGPFFVRASLLEVPA